MYITKTLDILQLLVHVRTVKGSQSGSTSNTVQNSNVMLAVLAAPPAETEYARSVSSVHQNTGILYNI